MATSVTDVGSGRPVCAGGDVASQRDRGRFKRDRRTEVSETTYGIVVRALHKSGSMFLYRFFDQVAADSGISYYSINREPATDYLVTPEIENSFCVCPVRTFNPRRFGRFECVDRVTQIYHLRDPRDIMVSEYYSFGWTHPAEGLNREGLAWRREIQKMSVDDYVLRQPEFSKSPLEKRLTPLLNIQPDANTIFVKYETMVTRFNRWARAVLPAFGIRWPHWAAARYTWKYRNEFRTSGEQLQHKRRVIPGDHREKLSPSTIATLNERYAAFLKRFGYVTAD